MDNKIDKRIKRSEKALKESFLQLLKIKPYSKITVIEIVENSTYSKPTFYAHFVDKEDLIERIINDEVFLYVDGVCKTIRKGSREFSYEMTLSFFNYIYDKKDFFRIILSEKGRKNAFMEKTISEIKRRILLEKRKDLALEINWDLYAYISTQTYFSIIKYWINNDFELTPEYIARQYYNCRIASVILDVKE